MTEELENWLAKRFIQRIDVKAVQLPKDALHPWPWYCPDNKLPPRIRPYHQPLGFRREHLKAHLAGEATYGHYILDENSRCKVITFDIDLIEADPKNGVYGSWVDMLDPEASDEPTVIEPCSPRDLWADRAEVGARNWYKYQMKMLATRFCSTFMEMGLPTAAAYSGNKGIHVYGFVDAMPAAEAFQGAEIALAMIDEFEPYKGNHTFIHRNPDPWQGYRNFTVEVYPKQESLQGKTLGNLVRLPLGRNIKSTDPTFFLDLTTPMAEFKPHPDPVRLLREGNPFT